MPDELTPFPWGRVPVPKEKLNVSTVSEYSKTLYYMKQDNDTEYQQNSRVELQN